MNYRFVKGFIDKKGMKRFIQNYELQNTFFYYGLVRAKSENFLSIN